jgi:hypothetical protein
VSISRRIPSAPEKVWTVFTDLERYPDWLALHRSWTTELPDRIGQGTRVGETISVLGTAQGIDWEVEEYRAPTVATLSGAASAGLALRLVMSVEAMAEGATGRIDVAFSGPPVAGFLGRLVAGSVKRDLEVSADNLARLLR